MCSIRPNLPLYKQTETSDTAFALSKSIFNSKQTMGGAGLSPFEFEHYYHKAYAAYLANTYPVIEATLPDCHRCSASDSEKSRDSDRLRNSSTSTLSSVRHPYRATDKPVVLNNLRSVRMLRARQEGLVPPLSDSLIDDLVSKFGSSIPCADPQNCMTHANRFARIYLGHREERPADHWYKPEWFDRTPVDDNSNDDPLGSFSLTVDKLEAMREWSWLSIRNCIQVMAHGLAVSHWSIGCDGSNLGFVIGGSREPDSSQETIAVDPSPDSSEPLNPQDPRIYIFPPSPFHHISFDEKGIEACVKAFMTNKKPYFPKPQKKHATDMAMWETFQETYLQESNRFLEGDLRDLALAFIRQVEAEEEKRLEAGVIAGEMVTVAGRRQNLRDRMTKACKWVSNGYQRSKCQLRKLCIHKTV